MRKTLKLIEKYQRILEQDQKNPEAGMDQAPPPEGGDVTEIPAESPAEPEMIPLSSPAEIRYMEDVVLAALMEPPSGTDRIALENMLDLLRRPDSAERINQNGQTARDLYQQEILPIIRPAQQGEDIRDISDQMN